MRLSGWAGAVGVALVFMTPAPARAAEGLHGPGVFGPMYYLKAFGSPGHEIRQILLALTWLSVAVVAIITALVVIGVLRRRKHVGDMSAGVSLASRSHDQIALRWIHGGLVVTVGILFVFIIWTVSTMAAIHIP